MATIASLLILCGFCVLQESPEYQGCIWGRVVRVNSKGEVTPVKDASVYLKSKDAIPRVSLGKTDENGYYALPLTKLPPNIDSVIVAVKVPNRPEELSQPVPVNEKCTEVPTIELRPGYSSLTPQPGLVATCEPCIPSTRTLSCGPAVRQRIYWHQGRFWVKDLLTGAWWYSRPNDPCWTQWCTPVLRPCQTSGRTMTIPPGIHISDVPERVPNLK